MRLKSFRHGLVFLTTLCLLASCQKEVSFQDDLLPPGGGPAASTGDINGDWNFVAQAVKTASIVTMSEDGEELKLVATADYVTANNAGHLKVTENQFIFTGITVSVDAVVNMKTYLNGNLEDDSDIPSNVTNPPADNTIDYTRNNGDSLTFNNAIAMIPDPSGNPTPTPTGPMGAHVNATGDTLTIRLEYDFTTPITQNGVAGSLSAYSKSVMKFVR